MSNQPKKQDLPQYRCHKVVGALRIAAIEVHKDLSATIAPAEPEYQAFTTESGWGRRFNGGDDDDPGYYVAYEDGYTSWSPTKAFEEGYTPAVHGHDANPAADYPNWDQMSDAEKEEAIRKASQ